MTKYNNNNDISIEIALRERIKELECLYNISIELEAAEKPDEAYDKLIQHLIEGFQFPEITIAKLEIDSTVYGDRNCRDKKSKRMLKEDITINSQKRGQIQVCYKDDAAFFEEEKKMLREVSRMISTALEKHDLITGSEKYIKKIEDLLSEKTYEIEEANKRNISLSKLSGELDKSRKKLQTLFDTITETILVIDSDFNITMSNKEHIGNSGKCYRKLFKSKNVCDDCPAKKSFKEGKPISIVKYISNEYYKLQAFPILTDNGSVYKVIEKCSNITQEKQIEFQLRSSYKLTSLGKLVAGIAHEINNPNTFIMGNIKIAQEAFHDIFPILDNHYRQNSDLKIARLPYEIFKENISILLKDMLSGTNRIKKIVDGLREFARKDEGMLTDEVDINNVIETTLRLVGTQLRRNATIQINLDKDVPVMRGNIQKLEQVMVNMFMNAHEAIEGDNGMISVETKYDKKNNETIIEIIDNGRGIEKNDIENIFDPFFTTKRDTGGTGLGLSITYGIIKEHNGRIEVYTKRGSGTTFNVHIPCTQEEGKK
ncbi:ATP-binding protein [Candidatus Latescibacterota bacterium]